MSEYDDYDVCYECSGVRDENGKILPYGDPRVAIARSKTYTGIAQAFADQWG